MRRRALLACALPAVISGCIGSDPADNDGTDADDDGNDSGGDDDGNEVGESRYRVVVEAPEADPGERSVCEFESLSDAVQEEFKAAIDGVDFETDDRGHYTSTDSPSILDTDCYNVLIAYEGEYYPLIVEVDSG